jgi:5,10-methylenetetrahydrofolate reductase
MKFSEKLGNEFVVTGEFEPPKAVDNSFLEKAAYFKDYADAINSTDAPLGEPHLSALVACHKVEKELGIEPVLQMCARDRNKTAIEGDLLGAKLLKINNVLCLTGDYPTYSKPVFELDAVRFARLVKEEMPKKYPGFEMTVGVAHNSMAKPNKPEQINLERKMKWADFVQTQPVFDFSQLENDVIEEHKDRILVGVMPLLSQDFAKYFNLHIPGFDIPKEIIKLIEDEEDGIRLARETIDEAKKQGFGGVHLMLFKVEHRIEDIMKGLK